MLSWNGVKRAARMVCAGLAGLALPAAAPAADALEPKPAMWKLADADTTIYLFGTIHMLPKYYAWRTPAFDKAVAESDELVLETIVDASAMQSAKAVNTLGVSAGLPPLVERVPEDKRAALVSRLKSVGLPENALDRFESWAAAMMLLGGAFKDMGLEGSAGVERTLTTSLAQGGKKISGLETIDQQFGFLDGLSDEAQQMFLIGVLEDPADARANFRDMLRDWTVGDVDGIARSFDQETAMSPELRAALMSRRNAAWADWLAKRMDQPGTVMVAVGAGHLAGSDSVQKMLADKGLKVTRVQ